MLAMTENQIVFKGERLKALRKLKGLSQEELADELNSADEPVSQTHVSRWERGSYNPLLGTTVRIAKYFDVTVDYLVGESDDPGGRSSSRDDFPRNL